jgi:ketosteroid isomerase-like protein
MRKLMLFLICFCAVTVDVCAQQNDSAWQAVVDTEKAFARMSEEKGIRPSFMAFIADDGVLFRPKAVKGKQWMTEHPIPASDKVPLLRWRPSFADVARAGDMGYTFGPWEFKGDVHDERPSGFGHFVTIWKKQADGSWRFAVDLGISHPEPKIAEPEPSKVQIAQFRSTTTNTGAERETLVRLERAFSERAFTRGGRAAFLSHAAPDVRVFREGQPPLSGKKDGAEVIPTAAGVWSWRPEAWDVSQSGDLGYSYGSYELKANGTSPAETGNYYRIWKRQRGQWKVVVDLLNPVPAKG